MENSQPANHENQAMVDRRGLLLAAFSAFCVYFCMYAFRKPFTAATFEGQELWGQGFKGVIITSQLLGYMLSKLIGIKVVSEMRPGFRVPVIVGLIIAAELALVGFAIVPNSLKVGMMFLNGLPLGMVFGLVLAFLEGRKETEALTAVLCASFIVSSGAVKTVGRLVIEGGVDEFWMPAVVGSVFLLPLIFFATILRSTPPPDSQDQALRSERVAMSARQRLTLVRKIWPALCLLLSIYLLLTVARAARDDFGVEIWEALGEAGKPELFTISETCVALFVVALNSLAIWVPGNLMALRVTLGCMLVSFLLVILSVWGQLSLGLGPMAFMVLCGVGLYMPYVAFHTTVFERLLALTRQPGNLGFLMYLADSAGYIGYCVFLFVGKQAFTQGGVLYTFQRLLWGTAVISILALIAAVWFIDRKYKPRNLNEDIE